MFRLVKNFLYLLSIIEITPTEVVINLDRDLRVKSSAISNQLLLDCITFAGVIPAKDIREAKIKLNVSNSKSERRSPVNV